MRPRSAHICGEEDKFDAAGATIIGVSADSIARLNQFSADPEYCAGKFPVASDANREIAASYNLATTAVKPGQMDVRGTAIDHDFIERETFVIGKDHKIIATFSSKDDNLSPMRMWRNHWRLCSSSPPNSAARRPNSLAAQVK